MTLPECPGNVRCRALQKHHIRVNEKLTVDILGIGDAWLLVRRPAGTQRSAERLVVRRSSEGVLDDWFLQPAGLPDRHATGTDQGSQRLGAGLGRS